jgi:hypothetical protein
MDITTPTTKRLGKTNYLGASDHFGALGMFFIAGILVAALVYGRRAS